MNDLMAFEPNFQEPAFQFESDRRALFQQNWISVSPPKASDENENPCFDCNICFDSAHDPVVTLCGHLYCWPCIYKWIYLQSSSDPEHQSKCPICMADISKSSLVPLYGRGTPTSNSESKKPRSNLVIPVRPAFQLHNLITTPTAATSQLHQQYRTSSLQSHEQSFHQQQYFPDETFGEFLLSPKRLAYGEMLYARMFGTSETSLYAYPNTNTFSGGTNPRMMRRQEMEVHKSLNRLCIFFLCCIILCLFLF